jgi:transcriptional regulator with XRE-family HTH domain
MTIKLEIERKKRKLSQARLAAATGTMHPSSISVLEQGWRKPGQRQRASLEQAMREAGWNGEGDLFEEVEQ